MSSVPSSSSSCPCSKVKLFIAISDAVEFNSPRNAQLDDRRVDSAEHGLCSHCSLRRNKGSEVGIHPALQHLQSVLDSEPSYKALVHLREDRAQLGLDLMQKVMDNPETPSDLRRSTLHGMKRLCIQSGLFPQSLILQGVQFGGDPIASGGFGDIWEGTYQNIRVCVKVAKPIEKSKNALLMKTFTREAIIWRQLSHPNLLPFYGIYLGNQHGRIALVSPWQENGDIAAYLKARPESPRFPFVYDVLNGLEYLHDEHIVHEDLKAARSLFLANVLITSSGSACLADFGISSIAEDAKVGWTSVRTTPHGSGTVGWWAPELMLNGSRPNTSSDIYSLASVMYEIFTGQLPFYESSNKPAIIVKVSQGCTPTKPPMAHDTELSENTWIIMKKCWSFDPHERPSVTYVKEELCRIFQTKLVGIKQGRKLLQRTAQQPFPQNLTLGTSSFTEDEMRLLLACDAKNCQACSRSLTESVRGLWMEDILDAPCALSPSTTPSPTFPSQLPNIQASVRAMAAANLEKSNNIDQTVAGHSQRKSSTESRSSDRIVAANPARALQDHVPGSASQIAFTQDEILDILVSKTRKWWLGKNSEGAVGLVPSDALAFIEHASVASHTQQKEIKLRAPIDPFVDKAEVWESYKADLPDELSVRKGEILDVAHAIGPSWLARKKDGIVGLIRFRRVFLKYRATGAQPIENYPVKAVALLDCPADNHDSRLLFFAKDEVVGVIDKTTEEWWLAQNRRGAVGHIRAQNFALVSQSSDDRIE